MKVLTTLLSLLAGAVLLAAPAIAQDKGSAGANTNMEILLQKVKADKKLLVAANMDLSDVEGKSFWPLYDGYQKELGQLNQRIGKAIVEYADAYNKGPVPNDTAKKLMTEVLAVEQAEAKAKSSVADNVGKVLSATQTARYIQIETKIRAVVRFELAKQIPLVD